MEDTSRELDKFVKTVLTFGDKPAPAMAQIALRKTAQGQATNPKAVDVLTNNVYVDDIRDSVNTIKEAQGLSNESTAFWLKEVSVLKNGSPTKIWQRMKLRRRKVIRFQK